jgi:transcriptional regulator GlxA family with amidase domain
MTKQNVGIFLFDDVEVLDFAGPFEVFSRTRLVPGAESRRSEDSAPFDVFTVARNPGPIRAIGGLQVIPTFAWDTAPPIDILVVPGGFGTRALLRHDETLAWIRRVAASASLVTQNGLLRGRRATTHWAAHDLLVSIDPTIELQRDVRVVVDTIFTSAGVSAGLDMAFAVVEQLHGAEVARETARYIEYVPQYQDTV